MESQYLEIIRGDGKTLTIRPSIDVTTADSIIFTVKSSKGDPDSRARFQHALGSGLSVSEGNIVVNAVADDTNSITGGSLVWDTQAQFNGSDPVTVAMGTLSVIGDVTRELDTSVDIHTVGPGATENAITARNEAEQFASDAEGFSNSAQASAISASDSASAALDSKNSADSDKNATAADRVQTGLDRTQTGLDRTAVANDKATVLQAKTDTLAARDAAQLSETNAGNSEAAAHADALLAATYQARITAPTMAYLSVMALTGINAGDIAKVADFAATDDGGGGEFELRTSSDALVAGMVLSSSVAGKQWHRKYSGPVNIRWCGATGNGITDDLTSMQLAADYCISKGEGLSVTRGTYKTTGAWDIRGLKTLVGDGVDVAVILSDNVSEPVVRLGGVFGMTFGRMTIGYSVSTAGETSAQAIALYKLRRSSIRDMKIVECYSAFSIPQENYAGTGNFIYSVAFDSFQIIQCRGIPFDLRSYLLGSTGCTFNNIYINGFDSDGVTKIAQATPFFISGMSESKFTQINFEWMKCPKLVLLGSDCGPTVWESLHIEGVEPTDDYEGFFEISSNVQAIFNGVNFYNCSFLSSNLSPGNIYSLFRLGAASRTQVDGLYFSSCTVTGVTVPVFNVVGTEPVDVWCELGHVSGDKSGLTIAAYANGVASQTKEYLLRNGEYANFRCIKTVYSQGDADSTHLPNRTRSIIRQNVTLTADRTLTLSTVGAWVGAELEVIRVSSGAYNWSIGGLKNLATNQWATVVYDGSAWLLKSFGSL